MREHANLTFGRRRLLRLCVVALAATVLRLDLRSSGKKPELRYFNVPEGRAIEMFKLAVKQAKVEIILSAEMLKEVRTRKIRGVFTPIEAFNRMLSGSPLEMVRHEKSGVYAMKKIGDSKITSQISKEPDAAVSVSSSE